MLTTRIIAWVMSILMFFSAGFSFGGRSLSEAAAIAKNSYAQAGYELTQKLLTDCYNITAHTMNSKIGETGMPYVWGAACFVEAISDAYRLFPANARLKTDYRDALKKCLPKYLATDQTIHAPSGDSQGITYYNASAGNQGDFYYDDNAWVCIQLLTGYRNLKDASLLEAAETNLEFLWTGWDDALGGGIYWSSSFGTKNACANGPTAISFLMAYQFTGNETYLSRGKQIYDWMNETMREDDLFLDAISADGRNVDHWKAAYNQATMIYAGCLLYEITGEQRYYDLTKATVDATVPLMFTETAGEDGRTEISMRANPIFTAWCIGWLARAYVKFYETDPAKDTAPLEHLKAVMTKELETKTAEGLYDPFFCSGASEPDGVTGLLAQGGVAATLLNTAYYDAVLQPDAD